jgi:methyl-accepting chemotaxis protein
VRDKLNNINEKLNAIDDIIKEIEAFTHKHTELFEALNQKFPNIEQFSNALKDANELYMFVEGLKEYAKTCSNEIKSIELLLASKNEEEAKTKEIKQTITEALLKINVLNDEASLKQELSLLISKIGDR